MKIKLNQKELEASNSPISHIPNVGEVEVQSKHACSANDEQNECLMNIEIEIGTLQRAAQKRDNSLYRILRDSYKLYHTVEVSRPDMKFNYLQNIDGLCQEGNIKSKSTTLHTKVIRLVFARSEMNRQQVSTYANVLKNAFDVGTGPDDFHKWLKGVGGISTASRLASTNGSASFDVNDDDARAEGQDVDRVLELISKSDPIASITDPSISEKIGSEYNFKLALCQWDYWSGELKILRLEEDEEKVKRHVKNFSSSYLHELGEEMAEETLNEESVSTLEKITKLVEQSGVEK